MTSASGTALVIGGGGLLGQAVCAELAKRGLTVVVASRNLERNERFCASLRELGLQAIARRVDILKPVEIDDLVVELEEIQGGLSVLINAANRAISQPALEMSLSAWQSAFDGNVGAYFRSCQAAARVMAASGGGAILNFSSILAHRTPMGAREPSSKDPAVNYAAAKGAVTAMSRFLAVQWAPLGIRVNVITPGAFPGRDSQAAPGIPLGRTGRPEEIAKAAAFLCSADASYITGQELIIDGGWLAVL